MVWFWFPSFRNVLPDYKNDNLKKTFFRFYGDAFMTREEFRYNVIGN